VAGVLAVTGLIALAMLLVYARFPLMGVSNVWRDDGLNQIFPARYFADAWLRHIVAGADGGVVLWSWSIGLGADVISTLAFHALGDPFGLVGLAFPADSLETAYFVALLLRVMVAGLIAWAYLRCMGARSLAAVAGAIVYIFTTFTLIAGLRHPFFMTPVVMLPALLIGIERVLRDGRYGWLVASVFVAAVANPYFFYQLAILVATYAVARYLERTPRREWWPGLGLVVLRLAAASGLGVLLAAPVVAPTVAAFLGTWRIQGEHTTPLLYAGADYYAAFAAVTLPVAARYSMYLGYAIVAVMLAPVLFLRRGNAALKVMLVVLPILVLVPYAGSAFNAFTFPNNRFVFAAGLFLGLGTALVLSDPTPLRRRDLVAMGLVLVGLLVPVGVLSIAAGWPPIGALGVPAIVGMMTWLLFALEASAMRVPRGRRSILPAETGSGAWRASGPRLAILVLLLANVAGNAAYVYDGPESVLPEYVKAGTVLERFRDNAGWAAAGLLAGDGAHRVENADRVGWGDALIEGYPGTAFYFSIQDERLTRFELEHAMTADGFSFRYDGSDDRAALTTLAGVRYYLADRAREEFVPFGFERVGELSGASVWENREALPIGFLYDRVISRADYERLGLAARGQALLQGAVVETGDAPKVPVVTPSVEVTDVPYTVAGSAHAKVDIEAGEIVTTGPDPWVDLDVTPVPGAELYVLLEGFDAVTSGPFIPDRRVVTTYSAGGAAKRFSWLSETSPYYWGNRTQLVNLGYREDGVSRIRLGLEGPGTTRFDRLRVLAIPMTEYASRVERLRASSMRGIWVGTNTVTGRVTSTGDSVLFLGIPYSTGWTAEVDGVQARVFPANTAFMGLAIGPGDHSVTLRYTTPWLGLGIGLALGALLVALAAAGWQTRRRRRRRTTRSTDGDGSG
jgi:uncharacterized membrane protein YfhO